MKKLFAIIGILAALSPYSVFAAYGLSYSIELNESNARYLSRADNALLQGGAENTVECWIKMDEIVGQGVDAYVIASKGTSTGSQREFVLKVTDDGAGNIALVTQTSSSGTGYEGSASVSWSPAPSNAVWYHVVWTRNGANENFYVDASQMGTTQTGGVATIYDGTGSFGFGAENISGTPGDYFDGEFSLCRFWQTERTQLQIADNYCNVIGSGPAGEWTLDNTLNDNSGNSLTLTNNNSAVFGIDTPSICATSGGGSQTVIGIIES